MNDLLAGNEHAACRIRVSRYFFLYDICLRREASRVGRINYAAKCISTETPGQLRPR